MEKYHEVLTPIREVVQRIGNFVVDKVLPTEVLTDLFNGVSEESATRTQQMFEFPPHEE